MKWFIIALTFFAVLRMGAYAQCCGDGHAQHHQHSQHQEHSSYQEAAETTNNIPAKFRSQLSEAVQVYLELRDALAKDDGKLAAGKTTAFQTALDIQNMSIHLITIF